jgi:hypothetical protein
MSVNVCSMQKAIWGLSLLVLTQVVLSEASCGGIAIGIADGGGQGGSAGQGGGAGMGGGAGSGGSAGTGGFGGGGGGGFPGDANDESASEDSASEDAATEDSGGDGGIDAPFPYDGSIVPGMCATCLSSSCKAYAECIGDPACVAIFDCLHECVLDGGMTTSCAINCVNDSGSASAQGFAAGVLQCVTEDCRISCEMGVQEGGVD